MRALPLLSAVLCLALAGCGVRSSRPVTPAPASPAAPLATATPATGARVSLLELCASVKARQQNANPTALADALLGAATDDLAPYLKSGCLAGEVKADLGLLALRFTNHRAILWRQGDKWQAAELEALADRPQILSQTGPEVLFATEAEGTGHDGYFGLLRRVGNDWHLLYQSPAVSHFGAALLDPAHVLVQGRNTGDAPLAWTANYAIPSNYQWLWQRKGDSFSLAAERLVPDPAFTVSVFLGALQQHKDDWLARIATPAAVADARKLGLDRPGVQVLPPTELSVSAKPEWRYWSALPAAQRGPAPTETSGFAVVPVQKGTVPAVKLALQRMDAGWVVAGVAAQR